MYEQDRYKTIFLNQKIAVSNNIWTKIKYSWLLATIFDNTVFMCLDLLKSHSPLWNLIIYRFLFIVSSALLSLLMGFTKSSSAICLSKSLHVSLDVYGHPFHNTTIKAKIMVYFPSQDIDLPTQFFSLSFTFSKPPSLLCWFFPEESFILIEIRNSKNEIGKLIVLHNEFHYHKASSCYVLLVKTSQGYHLCLTHTVSEWSIMWHLSN